MRVLSIDFDYFQRVTKRQLEKYYPDSVDLPTSVTEVVWSSYYANNPDEMQKISILQTEYKRMLSILQKQSKYSAVMIANSHKHIYDFICSNIAYGDTLSIVNVDFHPDTRTDNFKVDCGNWVSYLVGERNANGLQTAVQWIPNTISLSVVEGSAFFTQDKTGTYRMLDSLKAIQNEKFDLIFLCRSDTWVPPHLDKYFVTLCEVLKTGFCDVQLQVDIDKPRTQYLAMAQQLNDEFGYLFRQQRKQ